MSGEPDERRRRRFGLNLSASALDILFVIGAVLTALGGVAALTDRSDTVTLIPALVGLVILVAVAGFSDWWELTDEDLRQPEDERPSGSALRMALFTSSTALAVVAVLRMAAGDGSWFTRFVLPVVVLIVCIVGLGHAAARRPRRETSSDT